MHQCTYYSRQKEDSISNTEDSGIQFFDLSTEIPASLNQKWCRKRVVKLPVLRIKPYIKHAQVHTCCCAGWVRTHTSTYRWPQFVLGCLISDVLLLKSKDNFVSTGPHLCGSGEGIKGGNEAQPGYLVAKTLQRIQLKKYHLIFDYKAHGNQVTHICIHEKKRWHGNNNLHKQQIKCRTHAKMVGCTHQYKLAWCNRFNRLIILCDMSTYNWRCSRAWN